MDDIKKKTVTYFWITLNLFAFAFISQRYSSPGWSTYSLYTVSVISLCLTLAFLFSQIYKNKRLVSAVERVCKIPVSHIAWFLPLVLFSINLIEAKEVPYNLLIGVILVCLFFALYSFSIGWQSGKSLTLIFDKLNIFQPSVEIPKEFRNLDWRL